MRYQASRIVPAQRGSPLRRRFGTRPHPKFPRSGRVHRRRGGPSSPAARARAARSDVKAGPQRYRAVSYTHLDVYKRQAHAKVHVGVGGATLLDSHAHQLEHRRVDGLEGVVLQNLLMHVQRDELGLGIVAREAEGRLREVVGAKACLLYTSRCV